MWCVQCLCEASNVQLRGPSDTKQSTVVVLGVGEYFKDVFGHV